MLINWEFSVYDPPKLFLAILMSWASLVAQW